jgi:DNA-binding MarR family transcriptional regulator
MKKPKPQKLQPFRILDYPLFDMAKIVAMIHANIVNTAPGDITPSRWRVIAHLGERESLTINELAKLAVIERSALSRVVENLEHEGFVRRRRNAVDSRSVEVSLTVAGCRLYDKCSTIARDEIERALSALSGLEQQKLREYLARVRANIVEVGHRPERGDSTQE